MKSASVITSAGFSYEAFRMILFWLFLILVQKISQTSSTTLQDAFYNRTTTMDKPLEELVSIVKFVQEKKWKELKDFLTKSTCETKIQYAAYVRSFRDAYDVGANERATAKSHLFKLTNLIRRMRILLDLFNAERVRDVTDVMVTVSETAKLHDDFLSAYASTIRDTSEPDLKFYLENTFQLRETDTKNVCLEMINRKRADPGASSVNAPETAQRLKDEMKKWSDKRDNLDAIMMETPSDQLNPVFEEFKKINDGKSLVDTFSEEFKKDGDKLTVYKQLAAFATDKIAYFADELEARMAENMKGSLPVAYTIVFVGALSKEDRDKVKVEYKKRFNIELIDQLGKMVNESGFEDVILQLMNLYMDDLKKL